APGGAADRARARRERAPARRARAGLAKSRRGMRGIALVGVGALLGALPAIAAAARIAWLAAARRRREAALRHALEGRVGADRVMGGDAPELDPQGVRRRRHEANNALSTALLSAQFLAQSTRDEMARSKPLLDQNVAAEELVEALHRLKRIVEPQRAAT